MKVKVTKKMRRIIKATGNEMDNLMAMDWTDIASQYGLNADQAKWVADQLAPCGP